MEGTLLGSFFCFREKSAYEMRLGLVGSVMCVRDSQQAPLVREALQSAELIVGLTDGPEAYILGFIGLQNDYIAGIFICNDAQHQGLGTALLATAQADHHQLQLNVYVANRPAIAFYHYHGFRVID